MKRQALAAAAVLVTGVGGLALEAATAAADPPPLLCAIQPVATLLGCTTPTTTTTPPQQQTTTEEQSRPPASSSSEEAPTTTATATSGVAGASTPALEPAPQVVRSSTKPQYVPNTLLVRFKPGTTPAQRQALLAQIGATIDSSVPDIGVKSINVSPSQRAKVLAKLRASPLVAHAEEDLVLHLMGTMTPNDTFYAQQWGLTVGDFTNVLSRPGGRVVVGVVDSGVDAATPDLAGAVLPGIDLTGTGLTDQNGHGTAVAGVIAARAGNGIGGAGVCQKCKILPVKVTKSDGTADTALVAKGIVTAVDHGARVINVSMGGPESIPTLQQAVDYAASKGAIVVAAAGNSGVQTVFYPAGYPNVLSVAGSTPKDGLYGWSNRGKWVDVAAPGCNVGPLVAGGYGLFCGTSSATPLTAGLVALIRSSRPHASVAQVISAIEKASKHVRVNVKFGRIDAGAALASF